MHLEPNNERTPSNTKKLKLKSFHKRQIFVRAIKNLLSFRPEKPRKEIHGSGSGGSGEVVGSFSYILKAINQTIKEDWPFDSHHKEFTKIFNKQQFPGKLILINGKYFRIC